MWGETEGVPWTIGATGEWTAPLPTIFTHAPHPDDCRKLQLHDPACLRTRLFTPQGPFSQTVLDIFTSRFTSAENFNFTRGLCLHKDYVAGREFVAWKGGCCSGWGSPQAAFASGSLGPALPLFLEVALWAPAAQGPTERDGDVCQEAGPGAGVGDSVAIRRAGEISTEREEQAFVPIADTHPDAFPNQLTPMRGCLYLVDGGFAINSPFPLSLLPQRAVDLILSFDYSLEAPFEVRCVVGRKRGSLLGRPSWAFGDCLSWRA